MDKPIPNEIMRDARAVYGSLPLVYDGWDEGAVVEIIARALMARDERAAGIARDQADADFDLKLMARKESDGNGALIHAAEEAAARSIATAILTYGESNG